MERGEAIARVGWYIDNLLHDDMRVIKSIRLISGTHVRFEFHNNLYKHIEY